MTDDHLDSKVVKQYLLSFGAVPIDILKSNHFGEDHTKEKPQDSLNLFQKVYQDIINELKKSPHVSDIEFIPAEKVRAYKSNFGDGGAVLQVLDIIKIKCNLPERLQNLDIPLSQFFHPSASLDKSSNFTLFFDGAIFAFFRPIENVEGIHCGFRDSRQMLEDIFTPKFSIIQTFPTPLKQDFFIFFAL